MNQNQKVRMSKLRTALIHDNQKLEQSVAQGFTDH
jgi:hypothetical protein